MTQTPPAGDWKGPFPRLVFFTTWKPRENITWKPLVKFLIGINGKQAGKNGDFCKTQQFLQKQVILIGIN